MYVPDDVPLDGVSLDDERLGELPPNDALPDDVPLDDVVDNSIVSIRAFPISCIKAFLSGKIFISCCDNSTTKSITQGSNRNFKGNVSPAIL